MKHDTDIVDKKHVEENTCHLPAGQLTPQQRRMASSVSVGPGDEGGGEGGAGATATSARRGCDAKGEGGAPELGAGGATVLASLDAAYSSCDCRDGCGCR